MAGCKGERGLAVVTVALNNSQWMTVADSHRSFIQDSAFTFMVPCFLMGSPLQIKWGGGTGGSLLDPVEAFSNGVSRTFFQLPVSESLLLHPSFPRNRKGVGGCECF